MKKNVVFITGGVNDFDPVMVKMDGIVAEQKFALMNKCEKQLFGCKLLVIGEVEELRPVTVIKAKFVVTYEDVESASRFSAQAKKIFLKIGGKNEIHRFILAR